MNALLCLSLALAASAAPASPPPAAAQTPAGTISVGLCPSGPRGIALDPLHGLFFVALRDNNAVARIDPVSDAVVGAPIPVDAQPVAVAVNPSANKVYVTNQISNTVSVIDSTNFSVTRVSHASFNVPVGVTVNPTSGQVYVANGAGNSVTVLNPDNSVATTIPTGNSPSNPVYNPNNNSVYVVNRSSNSVTVINSATNTAVGSPITVGTNPSGIALDQQANKLYVSNRGTASGGVFPPGTVSVIDAATNTVVGTPLPSGANPLGVAVNPATNHVYVANQQDNSVTVLNRTDGSVATTLTAPGQPAFMAVNPSNNRLYVTETTGCSVGVFQDSASAAITGVPNLKLVDPTRAVDTRPSGAGVVTTGFNVDGSPAAAAPIQPNTIRRFLLAGKTFGGVTIPADATSVRLWVTPIGTGAFGSGHMTVFPGNLGVAPSSPSFGSLRPGGLSVDLMTSGPNAGTIGVATDVAMDVTIDVLGFTSPSVPLTLSRLTKLTTPLKLVDTRPGEFTAGYRSDGTPVTGGPLQTGPIHRFQIAGKSFGGTSLPNNVAGIEVYIGTTPCDTPFGTPPPNCEPPTLSQVRVFPGDLTTPPQPITVLTPPTTGGGNLVSGWTMRVPVTGPNAGQIAVQVQSRAAYVSIFLLGYYTSADSNTPCATSFTDVPQSSLYYSAVTALVCRNVASGYGDNTYRPNNDATRAQLASLLAAAAGFTNVIPPTQQTFTDVPPTHPFWLAIERAQAHNVFSGYSCGGPGEPCDAQNRPYFRPSAGATRGQAAKAIDAAAGYNDNVPTTQQTFADVPPSNPFWLAVERVHAHGVMPGYFCGGPGEPCDPQNRPYFRVASNITRGQLARAVVNAFYPTAQTPQGEASKLVARSTGGTITLNLGLFGLTITIPVNALPSDSVLFLTQSEPPPGTGGLRRNDVPVGGAVTLDTLPVGGPSSPGAANQRKARAAALTYSQPVSVSLTYTDADLAGNDPNTLQIFRYDAATGTWTPLPTTVNTATRTLTATSTSDGTFQAFASPPPAALGNLKFVTPVRILDTRGAPFGPIGANAAGGQIAAGQLADGSTTRYKVAGQTFGGTTIPNDITGVLINVTLVQGQASGGFVTVYPGDAASPPNASTVNPSTAIAANFWATGVPAGGPNAGTIAVTSVGGARDLLIDLVGYYSPSAPASVGNLKFVNPVRVLDTRPSPFGPIGYDGAGAALTQAAPLQPNTTRSFTLAGKSFAAGAETVTFPSDVAGILAHVTIVQNQASGGFVTLLPGGTVGAPGTSTVNPSTAIAFNSWAVGIPGTGQAGAGQFSLYSTNALDVLVDVVGYWSPSNPNTVGNLTFITPTRALDTRGDPFGPIGFNEAGAQVPPGPLPSGSTTRYLVNGETYANLTVTLPADVKGVLANVTVVQPSPGGGFVTVFPGDAATAPNASAVNPGNGVAASFWGSGVPVTADYNNGTLGVYTVGDPRDVIIDIVGYFR